MDRFSWEIIFYVSLGSPTKLYASMKLKRSWSICGIWMPTYYLWAVVYWIWWKGLYIYLSIFYKHHFAEINISIFCSQVRVFLFFLFSFFPTLSFRMLLAQKYSQPTLQALVIWKLLQIYLRLRIMKIIPKSFLFKSVNTSYMVWKYVSDHYLPRISKNFESFQWPISSSYLATAYTAAKVFFSGLYCTNYHLLASKLTTAKLQRNQLPQFNMKVSIYIRGRSFFANGSCR